uniref:Uncharacterized protein n=1 Tax=Anguilla anguilla TaxID=7936 RepID=A0A0E9VBZ6_ANGAN
MTIPRISTQIHNLSHSCSTVP